MRVPNLDVWRYLIMERDNHTCQKCGKPANVSHHIKDYEEYPDLRLEIDNGEARCYKCHGLAKIGTHHKWHPVTYKMVKTEEELDKLWALQDTKYKVDEKLLSRAIQVIEVDEETKIIEVENSS